MARPAGIQLKPVIGAADDPYEREADRVADHVVSGPASAPPRITPVTPFALRPAAQRDTGRERRRSALAGAVQRATAGDRSERGAEERSRSSTPAARVHQSGTDDRRKDETVVQRATAGDRTAHDDPDHASVAAEKPIASERGCGCGTCASCSVQRLAKPGASALIQRATAGDRTEHDDADRAPTVQRKADDEERGCGCGSCASCSVQRATRDSGRGRRDGDEDMRDAAAHAITSRGPGAPLMPGVRELLESRMGVDLGHVRVHTGTCAERATAALGARAFTHRGDIWLGRGESAADTRLVAHEAAHVVQQGAAAAQAPAPAEARVQRFIPDSILERLNDYAGHIPGWTLFTVIIGHNPLTRRNVDRTATNLLGGIMGLVPFGTAIFNKLNEHGVVDDAFNWVRGELGRLDLSLGRLERTIEAAWAEAHILTSSFSENMAVLRRHFGALYDDVVSFAGSLVDHVLQLIKDAVVGVAERLLGENRAWLLIKKILGRDPLRDVAVQATNVEILEDFLLLIGQEQHLRQMRERGKVEEAANWIATQIATFMGLLGELRSLITRAWDAIQPSNLHNLMDNVRALAADAGGFLQRVWDFASTVAARVLEFIKQALLGWLASFANDVPGFHLLTVILGRNPFTGEAVPRTAVNLIRGFITLLPGGAAIYARLQETGTIARAAGRIEGAVEALGITWQFITGIFRGIWDTLGIGALAEPVATFTGIVDRFAEPVSRLFRFVGVVLREIISVVLEIMNFPSDLIGSIVRNAMAAIEDIKRDPVGFLLNMLAAVKRGFSSFFEHIVTHLTRGLADWLFRGLRQAGIQPPRDFSLRSVLGFVMEVLGISVERIWQKLGERLGAERVARVRGAIDRLTGIWTFVRDVQQRGVAAIWEYIQTRITGLWDMVLQKAKDWIMERIVNRAIQWLMSLLDITGIMPVINSFAAFFRAVQSAIDYLRDILAIVNDYVMTLAAVARGEIAPGAQKIERGLANAIPVAIGFLANQFGLSNIGEKIQEIVGGLREMVDGALNWLIDRAVAGVQSLLRSLGLGGARASDAAAADVKRQAGRAVQREIGDGKTVEELRPIVARVREQFGPMGLRSLELRPGPDDEYALHAAASPEEKVLDLAAPGLKANVHVTNLTARITVADPLQGVAVKAFHDVRDAGGQTVGRVARITPRNLHRGEHHVLVAEPQPGAGEVVLRTFSGGTKKGYTTDPGSHAEAAFMKFLTQQDPAWVARISRIEVRVSRSPCTLCSSGGRWGGPYMGPIRAILTGITNKSDAILGWETPYISTSIATTKSDMDKLAQDWTLTGNPPTGGWPPGPNKQKLAAKP
ncbi:MAG TPA: DUF4157 domain-containing protein [Longimicrobium sp.]|jgi:hypothetical protein|uniref:eCIS core domain-containing protein n=1 Tax=Longimicrobium sp. TaxID=2029185 RepID=UPI002EDB380E